VDARHRAYVVDVSYFCGKLEAYLRYKEIPFDRVEVSFREVQGRLLRETGIARVPIVQTPDGTWLRDTTPMIDWFEARYPKPPVVPEDPVQGVVCRILEDYADEWLWRPALHYRWSYPTDALHLSRRIAEESLFDLPVPKGLLRWNLRRRQLRTYVTRDGVTGQTREHVEGTYRTALARLEALLAEGPYLMGSRPSLVDFGFFASMFRHFGLDPTPAKIMRQTAPAVYAWLGRLWAARASDAHGIWPEPGSVPDGFVDLLRDAGETYLSYLHANAVAWRAGRRRLDYTVQGVTYRNCPVVRYRVWCRERLQDHVEAVPEEQRGGLRELLEGCGVWEPLFRDGRIVSGLPAGGDATVCQPAGLRSRWAALRDPWNPVAR
jgi:glutathione S-transferase